MNKDIKRTHDYIENRLVWYLMKLRMMDYPIHLADLPTLKDNDLSDVMVTVMQHPYKTAHIRWGKGAVELLVNGRRSELDHDILHEIFHVLLWHYDDMAHDRYASKKQLDDENERVCDTLAHIARNLMTPQ